MKCTDGSPGRPELERLTDLALNLHWAWNHRSAEIWALLDPELWAATHNPWVVLQTVSRAKLEAFLAQPENAQRIERLMEHRHRHLADTAWFRRKYPDAPLSHIGYFSMEFALSEALPIYSGGLGNVAGDQLKAACDLDVPVIGIGLLYQRGYFRQVIGPDGNQEAHFPYNDPGQLPIMPVRDLEGEWVRVELPLPGPPVRLRAWQVQVDRRTLYLLDSNDPANPPTARAITGELYGGGAELRLQQEVALGIGGWRLLRALGVEPEVCHLNEGHAALAVLERARCFAADTGCSFEAALVATRAGNVFTTHTAVPAGFDRFAPALVERYLAGYAKEELGISPGELLALGRENREDPGEPFNMAYVAARGSRAINGVSLLHRTVSRRLFRTLFPRWPECEVPVGSVTNGVHVPSWDSPSTDALWTRLCGHGCWSGAREAPGEELTRVPDSELWALRNANREALVTYIRERLPRELSAAGAPPQQVDRARHVLDPEALTLGFARRFATYKRPTLLLRDPARLRRLFSASDRPIQLVIAGKAHPADAIGQAMIAEWVRFSRLPDLEGRVVFIPDYDLLLAEHLVQGVDLWINTPRRPWEASGTSGMKVLVNGGLNLSALDGWWAEAFKPEYGWVIGDGEEHSDDPGWDAAESRDLYAVLEQEIVPAFYIRDSTGVPTAWTARMRASMSTLTSRFSTNRVVREYTERYYLPAAEAYRARAANGAAQADRLLAWQRQIAARWTDARFGALRVETRQSEHHFAVELLHGGLDREAIRVELFAEPLEEEEPFVRVMTRGRALEGKHGGYEYVASAPAVRPASNYTPRLIPHHPEASIPLEAPHILWQR